MRNEKCLEVTKADSLQFIPVFPNCLPLNIILEKRLHKFIREYY